MKKKDLLPVIIIVALFFIYPWIDRTIVAKWFPPKTPAVEEQAASQPADIPAGTELAAAEASSEAAAEAAAAVAEAPAEVAAEPAPAVEPEQPAVPAEPSRPEVTVELANDVARYVLTSKGAAIKSAAMIAKDEADETRFRYPRSAEAIDQPVEFDFSERACGAFSGVQGFAADADFVLKSSDARSVVFERTVGGLTLVRTITLGDDYQLTVSNEWRNDGTAPAELKGLAVQAGWMADLPGETDTRMPTLGADTLIGSEVEFWAGKFEKWFPKKDEGVVQSRDVPLEDGAADWLAVKNKYFAQLVRPMEEGQGAKVSVLARRGEAVPTRTMFIFPSTAYPFADITGELAFEEATLAPGESKAMELTVYVGPKVYGTLAAYGGHEEDILQLGFWRVIGIWILKLMVWFRDTIWPHNYGLSIILLTLVIRVIFWPLNRKSMQSTQRMQEVQPLLTAVREKYKSDPQRQQQEMMRIYKENKINPMGGCLPMLIQIPVFFALFVVLRGAIELRFSSFLWISDLSTPENLLLDKIGFGINILPIFMGLTMWWQQRLTPTSDPQQQKMMLMMPILFTVLFYSFPSGLSLYWSMNQVMMIVQLAWMRRKKAQQAAAKA